MIAKFRTLKSRNLVLIFGPFSLFKLGLGQGNQLANCLPMVYVHPDKPISVMYLSARIRTLQTNTKLAALLQNSSSPHNLIWLGTAMSKNSITLPPQSESGGQIHLHGKHTALNHCLWEWCDSQIHQGCEENGKHHFLNKGQGVPCCNSHNTNT